MLVYLQDKFLKVCRWVKLCVICCLIDAIGSLSTECTSIHALQQCARMLASPGLLSQCAHHLFPLCQWDTWGKFSHCCWNLHLPKDNWSHWGRLLSFISLKSVLICLPGSLKMAFSVETGPLVCSESHIFCLLLYAVSSTPLSPWILSNELQVRISGFHVWNICP